MIQETTFRLEDIPSQAGRIGIVTGANAGLGYETALELARKDMKVILACRDPEKAETARNKLQEAAPNADLDVMLLNLGSLADVRRFGADFRDRYARLDILVNNAGLMVPPYSLTEDGFESQFGVNYLGHYLLTSLLLDQMPDTPESRIVTLSSIAHRFGRINFDDLQWEKKYSKWPAYGQSKLACLMFAVELQRWLEDNGSKVLSVAAHPGSSRTELQRNLGILNDLYHSLKPPVLSQSAAEGALPTLLAALGPDVKGGEYYGPGGFMEFTGEPKCARKSKKLSDTRTVATLWEVSGQLTGAQFKKRAS